MRTRTLMCTMAAVVLAAGAAMAAEPPAAAPEGKEGKETKGGKKGKEDPQAMMAAYEKAGAPGEAHLTLKKFVGKWNVEMKSWMAPDQPPMESKGTAEVKPILGDRFVQLTLASTMMGKPFSGIGTTGYDNAKKKFVGTWMDSMSTGIMRSEGTADASGKVINSQITGTDPLTGKESKMRIVEKWESDDKLVEEFYEKKRGKEVKTMEIVYTRAPAK